MEKVTLAEPEYSPDAETTSGLNTWRDIATALWVGAIVGWIVWAGALILNQYVIGPVACQTETSMIKCDQTLLVSSGVASLLAGIVGLALLVRQRIVRPLLVVLAVGVTQWGIGSTWLAGLPWYFTALLIMLVTALFYAVFVWFTQVRHFLLAFIMTIVLVIGFRLLIVL
jgi:hypothetical protein